MVKKYLAGKMIKLGDKYYNRGEEIKQFRFLNREVKRRLINTGQVLVKEEDED